MQYDHEVDVLREKVAQLYLNSPTKKKSNGTGSPFSRNATPSIDQFRNSASTDVESMTAKQSDVLIDIQGNDRHIVGLMNINI